jgi:5-methylcytosine-specific restriction endonuclease McrA
MVWLRQHDGADEDPALVALARTQREADLLLGIHTALQVYCAKHPTNGFLPALIVRRHLRGRLLEAFVAAGLLHEAGHECNCMKGIAWPPGMTYHVHDYLRYNPTVDEYDVDRAKKAELKDRELQAAVRGRDRDLCRYCGELTKFADRVSARGLVFDHVDPAVANGAANLVVACRSCNSRKGKRTPEAAGMNLRPVPTDEPSTTPDPGWSAAEDAVPFSHNGPVEDGDQAPTSRPTNGSTNHRINGSTKWSTNRSASGPTTLRGGTGRDGTGRDEVGDAGPAGYRDQTGPATPRRNSRYPDPYRRTAITGPDPADHPGLPTPDDLARGPPPDGHPS